MIDTSVQKEVLNQNKCDLTDNWSLKEMIYV